MLDVLPRFSAATLALDPAVETEKIVAALRTQLRTQRKRGLVLGLSGGIDSSVSLALAVRAVGANNVQALYMPERDSDPESLELGRLVAAAFGVEGIVEDIGPVLDGLGCYARRDAAIREIVPAYGDGWACKVVIGQAEGGYNISSLVVQDPAGKRSTHRMPLAVYLGVVAATNMKQRTRKQLEYYHADRLNFAVLGTPNRLEYDQGFFVKNGDGAADIKPIAHLYKTQVYGMARHLGLPQRLCDAQPTTDTYSLEQGQDEFYFALPYRAMDLALWALDHDVAASELARALDIDTERAEAVYTDIRNKRRTTRYQHLAPVLIDDVAAAST